MLGGFGLSAKQGKQGSKTDGLMPSGMGGPQDVMAPLLAMMQMMAGAGGGPGAPAGGALARRQHSRRGGGKQGSLDNPLEGGAASAAEGGPGFDPAALFGSLGLQNPFATSSLDRMDKRKLLAEIKDEMKTLITSISDYQVEQAVSIVKTQLRKLEVDNELDKKRIEERFEKEIAVMTSDFKKQVTEVRKDFTDDIRGMQKNRARDKTDQGLQYKNFYQALDASRSDVVRHQGYLETVAQTISLLMENINMQMEAEYSDLVDRKLISLYGIKPGKPTKMDQAGTEARTRQSAHVKTGFKSPSFWPNEEAASTLEIKSHDHDLSKLVGGTPARESRAAGA
jgi:hypothetical protein